LKLLNCQPEFRLSVELIGVRLAPCRRTSGSEVDGVRVGDADRDDPTSISRRTLTGRRCRTRCPDDGTAPELNVWPQYVERLGGYIGPALRVVVVVQPYMTELWLEKGHRKRRETLALPAIDAYDGSYTVVGPDPGSSPPVGWAAPACGQAHR